MSGRTLAAEQERQDREHQCIVAFELCGCLVGVTVLTGYEASAYKDAAGWAKSGFRCQQMTVADFRSVPLRCSVHPKGPPWWKSHGGNGKRPAEYATPTELGL